MIETALGPIKASRLEKRVERSTVAAGELVTTMYLLDDVPVKVDQHLDVSEAALEAISIGSI